MKHTTKERQQVLHFYLEQNFKPGKFFSIEQVVNECCYDDGTPCYKLNTNPLNHDKCIVLSNDVRAINWTVKNGFSIIIKDPYGGVKLCEDVEEFKAWRQSELEPLIKKTIYLNNLKFKSTLNGTMDLTEDDKIIETLVK